MMKTKNLLIGLIALFGCFNQTSWAVTNDKLAPYMYEDTKRLVALVEDAAALVEEKGEAAFKDFSVKNSRWFSGNLYLFVYDLDGICQFHPIEPNLVGKDLILFRDINQKPVISLITDVGKKPAPDAHGWVFYLWEVPHHYAPRWKSSYIRKAIAPNGKVYLVGSGLYNMKIEKVFIEEQINLAAELFLTKGKEEAIKELRSPESLPHVLEAYILVVDGQGGIVVDPSFPTILRRNITDFRDITGKMIVKDVEKQLEYTDSIWSTFLWPKYESNVPSRALLYVRKVKVGDEVFFICGSFFPVKPIWMKA